MACGEPEECHENSVTTSCITDEHNAVVPTTHRRSINVVRDPCYLKQYSSLFLWRADEHCFISYTPHSKPHCRQHNIWWLSMCSYNSPNFKTSDQNFGQTLVVSIAVFSTTNTLDKHTSLVDTWHVMVTLHLCVTVKNITNVLLI
jgi:hypothetical protein